MKKTTQLTLNKPEQMILDEALSFYFLNNTNTHLSKEGVLKLCDIRLRIGENIGIIRHPHLLQVRQRPGASGHGPIYGSGICKFIGNMISGGTAPQLSIKK